MFIKPKCLPWIAFNTDPEGGSGGDGADSKTGGSDDTPVVGENGFPEGTPVKEMTVEQQAAYWKHKARKHEKNRKPEDFDDILADAQKWRDKEDASKTPDQKAVEAARDAGRQEGIKSLLHDAVRAELKAHRPHMGDDDLDEFLEDVNLDRFYTDGRIDTERVGRLAEKLASAPDDDGDDKSHNESWSLGDVLGKTRQPARGKSGSLDEARERTLAKYSKKPTK